MRKRHRWLRWLAAGVTAYAVSWGATAICGPAAAARWNRQQEDAHYGSMGLNPEQYRRRLRGFTAPVPFVVTAKWECDGRPFGRHSSSGGDLWGVWLPGGFRVVRDNMRVVACG